MVQITKEKFGEIAGRDVYSFTLSKGDMTVCVIEYGAALRSVTVPDRDGKPTPVALGLATLDDYRKNQFFLGAICGRHANRIEGASFCLNGKEYFLEKNEGDNSLHSGKNGFHSRVFSGTATDSGVSFTLQSPALDQGFPGNVEFTVTYTMTDEGGLRIDYSVVSDEDTVMNPTSHAYFNLSGKGSVLRHEICIAADFYTPISAATVPTGEIRAVTGTAFDLTSPTPIEANISAGFADVADGYDHNFVLRADRTKAVATVLSPDTGITMNVYTDMPGIQFYSGNFLDGYSFPNGRGPGGKHSGFCLETQYFPNSLRFPHFPQPVIKAGQVFGSFTEYRFSTAKSEN